MPEGPPKLRIGVAGGGVMGSGIAQLAAFAGFPTLVVDPLEEARERARARIDDGLRKALSRAGRAEAELAGARELVGFSGSLDALSGCGFVIEAVPEEIRLKRNVLSEIAGACSEAVVIATNTSSLSVTRLANGISAPQRVVGTHFFNPAPLMKLVEVIPGLETSQETLAAALALCEALGKTPLVVRDTPGFLVNRCARPFYGEALRLLQEGVAEPSQIDRIVRVAGGFRMGPFELMDVIGNDISLETTKTFLDQSFGEPRWRPSPLQQQLVSGGRLGRKTGAGWYRYGDERADRDGEPAPSSAGGSLPRISVSGSGPAARIVRDLVAAHPGDETTNLTRVLIHTELAPAAEEQSAESVEVLLCAYRSLASWRRAGAVGFNLTPTPDRAPIVELTRGQSAEQHAAVVEALFRSLGVHVEWVGDAPGLVFARILTQLINEACFAVGEGVSEAAVVDEAMRLGLNYPRGPFEWAEHIGWAHVLDTLEGIWNERREERYRPAPLLQQLAWRAGESTGDA
jgi:3-hydroxybutyryl-CoA dehydrogenase